MYDMVWIYTMYDVVLILQLVRNDIKAGKASGKKLSCSCFRRPSGRSNTIFDMEKALAKSLRQRGWI